MFIALQIVIDKTAEWFLFKKTLNDKRNKCSALMVFSLSICKIDFFYVFEIPNTAYLRILWKYKLFACGEKFKVNISIWNFKIVNNNPVRTIFHSGIVYF